MITAVSDRLDLLEFTAVSFNSKLDYLKLSLSRWTVCTARFHMSWPLTGRKMPSCSAFRRCRCNEPSHQGDEPLLACSSVMPRFVSSARRLHEAMHEVMHERTGS